MERWGRWMRNSVLRLPPMCTMSISPGGIIVRLVRHVRLAIRFVCAGLEKSLFEGRTPDPCSYIFSSCYQRYTLSFLSV